MLSSVLLAGCLWIGQAEAADAAERDQFPQLPQLIRQLDDDRLVVREAAEATLIEMGPGIMDRLPSPAADVPPEVKERLRRIRRVLELKLARGTVAASRVTLTGEMSSVEAFRAIQEQTANRLVGYQDKIVPVTLDFQQTPFWIAIDQLMDKCQLSSEFYSRAPQTLALQPRPTGQRTRVGNASYQGIFRIAATQTTAVRDLRNPQNASLRVRMAAEWEPRVTPISLSIPMDKLVARDEAGNRLSKPESRGVLNATVTEDFNFFEIDIPLALPDRARQRIGSLSGVLEALIPGRVERFAFSVQDDVYPQSQKRAGVTVTLYRIIRNEDVYQVDVGLRLEDASDALESYRGWFYQNQAYLLDTAGDRMENDGMQTLAQGESEVRVAYLFACEQLPSDGRFVYETPVLIVNSAVPFELQDIALP